MVNKYLSHIDIQFLHGSYTVVVQSFSVQLLYKCIRDNVQGLEVDRRCHGGKNELCLRTIGGQSE